ncbi:MAG: hypothetical protein EHM21_02765 [Chloroflexi bacterium]|nr:MAG: hypothetical protein EHM21_02765 [Chloroflexota bacterium]
MSWMRTIPILNQVDVHAARMYTREAARLVGLELNEQAQVSMATSALAECLKMAARVSGGLHQPAAVNHIVIQVIEADLQGLEVDFESWNVSSDDGVQAQMNRILSLVDEVTVEQMPSGSIRAVMKKWPRQAVSLRAGNGNNIKLSRE